MNKNLLALAITATLAGCGGGDSGDNNSNDSSGGGSGLSGKAGNEYYLENALVCIDTDNDSICNTEEVSTNSSGKWTVSGQSSGRVLLRTTLGGQDGFEVMPATTEAGYTVSPVYNLTAPSGYTFVSPISTMVDYRVISGQNETVEAAENAIKAALGITQFYDIDGDYVSGSSQAQSLKNGMSSLPASDMKLLQDVAAATTLILQEASKELKDANASQEIIDESLEWAMKEINENFTAMANEAVNGGTPETIADSANIDMSNIIEEIEFSSGGTPLNNNRMNELLLIESGDDEDLTDLHFLSNCDNEGTLCYVKEYYEEESYENTNVLVQKYNKYKENTSWTKEVIEVDNGNVLTTKTTRNETGNGWENGHYYSKSSSQDGTNIDGEFFLGFGTIGSEVATKTVIKSQDVSGVKLSKVFEEDADSTYWSNALSSQHSEKTFTTSSQIYREDKIVLSDFETSYTGMEYPSTNSIASFALMDEDELGNSEIWTETTDPITEEIKRTYLPLETLRKMEVFSSEGLNVYVQLIGTNYEKTTGYINFLTENDAGVFKLYENTSNWTIGDSCGGCGTGGFNGVEKIVIDIPSDLQHYMTSYNSNAKADQFFIAQGRFDQSGSLVWGLTIKEGTVLSSGKVGYNHAAISFLESLADQ